jgi:hypothetical protein
MRITYLSLKVKDDVYLGDAVVTNHGGKAYIMAVKLARPTRE